MNDQNSKSKDNEINCTGNIFTYIFSVMLFEVNFTTIYELIQIMCK